MVLHLSRYQYYPAYDLLDSVSPGTAVSMFADDTKCHRAVRNLQDKEILQSDLNNIRI
jgi:hypothetical protein